MKIFNITIGILQTIILAAILFLLINNNGSINSFESKNIEFIPPPPRDVQIITDNNPIIGNCNAKVELIVFSDFECPYCYQLYKQIEDIKDDYIKSGRVKLIFMNYPLKMHENANLFAKISEYAYNNNNFEKVYSILYEKNSEINKQNYLSYLYDFFPDTIAFEEYINKPNKALAEDMKIANANDIKGVPVFIINNKLYLGIRSEDEFKEILDTAIKNNLTENEGSCG